MKKVAAAASPDAYVGALKGWRRTLVESMRDAVRTVPRLWESIKWGHLVYIGTNGPVCLIRAEDKRVLLGYWRGKQPREIEPRLKAGGKYEMANVVLAEGDSIDAGIVKRLTREAIRLNVEFGDPTAVAGSR